VCHRVAKGTDGRLELPSSVCATINLLCVVCNRVLR